MLGTGGTSLGIAVEAGATLLQLSGSVSTTAESRAIAAAAALARHWKLPYTPKLPTPETDPLPILDAILPLALTFSILTALSTKLTSTQHRRYSSTAIAMVAAFRRAIAIASHRHTRFTPRRCLAYRPAHALSAVAARRTAQLGARGLLAGVLAGALTVAYDGAGIAALTGGMCAGLSCRRVLGATHAVGLPATASTPTCSRRLWCGRRPPRQPPRLPDERRRLPSFAPSSTRPLLYLSPCVASSVPSSVFSQNGARFMDTTTRSISH